MKYKLSILFSLLLLISCKNQSQEKKETRAIQETISREREPNTEFELSDCDKYLMNWFPNDSTKVKYINDIISKNKLTKNNLEFLNALKNQKQEQEQFAFKDVLSPIFRFSDTEIGLFTFPKYKQIEYKLIPISKEMKLIDKFNSTMENRMKNYGKIKYYPMLLDSIFEGSSKPVIYYYTTNKIGLTKIMELGCYFDDCLGYYEYSIDTTTITKNDKVLFGSPYKIDLVFENNKKIDSLIKVSSKKECYECPNSLGLQRTFARIKGSKNLYFTYADTFPFNNELDTPLRALIFINSENEIIYLWYADIDLFGCSCL